MEEQETLLLEIIAAIKNEDTHTLRQFLDEIHPYDMAQALLQLDEDERVLFHKLTDEELADLIEELDYEEQQSLLQKLGPARGIRIIEKMAPDDAVDYLGELEESERKEIISRLNPAFAADINQLLRYPENTAGGLMTTEFFVLYATDTVERAIQRLRELAPDAESAYYLYVIDEKHQLTGVISIRELIVAPPETLVEQIMSERVVSVPVEMDQEEVARTMSNYGFLAVPVVKGNKMVGVITVDDAIDVLEEEASEDMMKFGGITGTDAGMQDLSIGPLKSAMGRIPWLVLLLGVGIMAGNIIAFFEDTLDAVVVLAVFIPMIAGMAGNTGTQSLAVVVRGLTMGQFKGKDVWRLIRREAVVGVFIGLVNGLIISIVAALWQKSLMLGFVIGLSLSVTLFFATLAGTIVPLIMAKMKIDPAFASGPFITTINDLVGLTIYFTVATLFMQYLI
ncbi:magnesium transporter [Anoxynatronum sibiricum]|uniref:Magnesium transporter MgtE n=1 Tax=Anoxynatronum sibiricum TaxID=210623 RepID=A0ABU9VS57_9CLOT